jgi:hypothetical protein
MKDITPINIWHNGANKQANKLNAYIVHDNLQSYCSLYYELLNETTTPAEPTEDNPTPDPIVSLQTLTNGNVAISGDAYDDWDGSNEYAYIYVANQLNIELI